MNLAKFYRALAPAIAALSVAAAGSAQTRPRIAVLGFENATASQIFGDQLGEAASDELTTQLVKSGAFSVIERRQIEDILAEQSMGMSGAVDPATAARIGKVLGVQYVLMGSISQFSIEQKSGGIGRLNLSASFAEAESKLDVRVVNTTTAEIVTVAEGGGKKRFGGATYKDLRLDRDFDAGIAQEALRPAVENAVEQIVSQKDALVATAPELPAGQVVGVREGSIYIDRGENAQVAIGQRFDVVRVVDTIRDANGNVLDEVTEKVGVIEVTRVLSQSAIGKVLEGEAKEGDRLRPNG